MPQFGASEDDIQAAICDHLRRFAVEGLFWRALCNNPRSERDGARLKRMGVQAGTPDMIFLYRGEFRAMEIKTLYARPTQAQIETQRAIISAGGDAVIARGLDDALQYLGTWNYLRKGKAPGSKKIRPSAPSSALKDLSVAGEWPTNLSPGNAGHLRPGAADIGNTEKGETERAQEWTPSTLFAAQKKQTGKN